MFAVVMRQPTPVHKCTSLLYKQGPVTRPAQDVSGLAWAGAVLFAVSPAALCTLRLLLAALPADGFSGRALARLMQAHLALNFGAGADASEMAALGGLLASAGAAWRDARAEAAAASAGARAEASAALAEAGVEHQVGAANRAGVC